MLREQKFVQMVPVTLPKWPVDSKTPLKTVLSGTNGPMALNLTCGIGYLSNTNIV